MVRELSLSQRDRAGRCTLYYTRALASPQECFPCFCSAAATVYVAASVTTTVDTAVAVSATVFLTILLSASAAPSADGHQV